MKQDNERHSGSLNTLQHDQAHVMARTELDPVTIIGHPSMHCNFFANQTSNYIKHAFLMLLCNSVIPNRTIRLSAVAPSFFLPLSSSPVRIDPTRIKFHPQLSIIHSYQTFLPSVWRQMRTSRVEVLGTYNGVCQAC